MAIELTGGSQFGTGFGLCLEGNGAENIMTIMISSGQSACMAIRITYVDVDDGRTAEQSLPTEMFDAQTVRDFNGNLKKCYDWIMERIEVWLKRGIERSSFQNPLETDLTIASEFVAKWLRIPPYDFI